MPTLWSSRAPSANNHNSNSNNATPTAINTPPLPNPASHLSGPANSRERTSRLSAASQQLEPPTSILRNSRPTPSPTRTPAATGPKHHTHTRSASNPLPKFFSRKKSNQNLRFVNQHGPLEDESAAGTEEHVQRSTSKKNKPDEDGKIARRCMCCDSRVKVPKDLHKFRCMCCLTVNDLRPVEEQSDEDRDEHKAKRAETSTGNQTQPLSKAPLSIGTTRMLIDRCLATYLENRCRHSEGWQSGPVIAPTLSTSPREELDPAASRRTRLQIPNPEMLRSPSSDAHMSSTPPDTPTADEVHASANTNTRPDGTLGRTSSPRLDTPPPDLQDDAGARAANVRPPSDRKGLPVQPTRKPPPPPMDIPSRPAPNRIYSHGSLTPSTPVQFLRPPASPRRGSNEADSRRRYDRVKVIFKAVEEYLIAHFGDYHCLNSSFSSVRPAAAGRTRSESNIPTPAPVLLNTPPADTAEAPFELDAKMLLLGDIGENGSWWTGRTDRSRAEKAASSSRKRSGEQSRKAVSSRSPNIDWRELSTWYQLVHTAGADWRNRLAYLRIEELGLPRMALDGEENAAEIDDDLREAREHTIRTLLKLTENLLKRPTRPLKNPEDARFLMIMLQNPSLYPQRQHGLPRPTPSTRPPPPPQDRHKLERRPSSESTNPLRSSPRKSTTGNEESQHNGLLKRIYGLLAHSSETCHRYFIGWFAYLEEKHFIRTVDLVAGFITHRLSRTSGRARRKSGIDDGGLIPDLSGSASNTSAQLLSAMGLSGSMKKRGEADSEPDWTGDWQICGAAKVMSLLFAANNIWHDQPRHSPTSPGPAAESDRAAAAAQLLPSKARRIGGQLLPTSSFYNSLLDYHDMIADFKLWEAKREKFTFSQYPLFLSMGTKIKILEYDARRQMEIKAREAYFDNIIRQRAMDGHFNLRIRRECIVEDSLRQISEAVGAGQEELKKGLRVHFTGEEGVDAGGPRKEWFLMLVRDIFDPNHGMFVYDEDSHACYFNPNSFETSDQYYLVGALLGLAIYNSTMLDVALPSFAFRKLLAAAPASSTMSSSSPSSNLSMVITGTKGQMTYTTADLAEFRPALAAGLDALLAFPGDVEHTYCWDFVAPTDRYGVLVNVPLKPNGENIPVTNANRAEFVDLYVRYLLDLAVARQFEPFKRGFFTVCAGNALSLFRAEEIELLVRGSDEPLDVDSLRAVAVCENWKDPTPPHHPLITGTSDVVADRVPVVAWFWALFREAPAPRQRQLLTFITGGDRIPAVGATSLVLRIVAGGDGWGGGGAAEKMRFPIARTCFNMLVLWHYDSPGQLAEKLWRAVEESEGFGLK